MSLDDGYSKILLHMDGADTSTTFTDESGKTWTPSNHAQIDTAFSEFGGASGLFDGTDDYCLTPNSTDFDFGTGDFTIDFWIRRNGTKAYPYIIGACKNGGAGWSIGLGNSDNKIRVYYGAVVLLTTGTVADTTWTHIAVVRYGATVTVYFGGVADATTWNVGAGAVNSDGTGSSIGRQLTDAVGSYWKGWIDELRVSKSIARWTANFTPPIYAYSPKGYPKVQVI